MKAVQLPLFDLPDPGDARHTFKALTNRVWTEHKAKLIARYLYYFVLITKHGAYIDGFAGPQQADKPESWAARLVLESEPRWFRTFFLCDRDPNQVKLLNDLKASQPLLSGREINVYSGDFNELVHEILRSDRIGEKVATFCLLDQRTFECDWRTVEALAAHKSARKIELFYFLPSGWFERAVSGLSDKSLLEKWWGRPDWDSLLGIDKFKQADLICQRFRDELGYRYAHPLPIFGQLGGRGRLMYFMVHATDHYEAPNLMVRAYRKATGALEPLKQLRLEFDEWRAARSS